MKKHYSKILMVLLIVVILCAALAGCNGKDVEKTDTADIAAFATKLREADSFTVELNGIAQDSKNTKIKSTCQFDGEKVYYVEPYDLDDKPQEIYLYIIDKKGRYYEYDEVEKQWYYYIEELIHEDLKEMKESSISFFNSEKFEYSQEKKAFTVKIGKDVGGSLFGYDILNNELSMVVKENEATITLTTDYWDVDCDVTLTIKDINSTKVTLPANAIEYKNPTDDNRRSSLSDLAVDIVEAKSFTFEYNAMIEGVKTEEASIKFDANKLHMKTKNVAEVGKDEDIYMSVLDGKLYGYQYDFKDSKWYYHVSEDTELFYRTKRIYLDGISNLLRDDWYEYDYDKKAYVLKDNSSLGHMFSEVTIVFGNDTVVISIIYANNIAANTVTISGINSTKITLPENAIERID